MLTSDPHQRNAVLQMRAQDLTLGEIAAKTGIPKTSLHRYLAAGPTAQKT